MIEIDHAVKTFDDGRREVHALRDVSLRVEKGDIYGIVGFSGAGKSTLLRLVNGLEKPDSGTVRVAGQDISALGSRELLRLRRRIGMVFQQFNLLERKTVRHNVALPLLLAGTPRQEAERRVKDVLRFVELEDKENAYVSQLSGGQKQRVGIARALATSPEILLCDEATSALDPQTTGQILALLKKINSEMGITIVIITHQMSVVREICNRVAIIENGLIVESGEVSEIFAHPKSRAARQLIIEGREPDEEGNIEPPAELPPEIPMENPKIRIVFSKNSSFEPVIANMVLHFARPVNILKANTRNLNGIAVGEMILGLPEEREVREEMVSWLEERGLEVEEVTSDVVQ